MISITATVLNTIKSSNAIVTDTGTTTFAPNKSQRIFENDIISRLILLVGEMQFWLFTVSLNKIALPGTSTPPSEQQSPLRFKYSIILPGLLQSGASMLLRIPSN